MNKTFVPQTRVPGAILVVDEKTYQPILDKKGRCQWDLSRCMQTGVVEHMIVEKQVVVEDGKAKTKMVKVPAQVPVYRGVAASYYRLVKSQFKRLQRIEREKEDGSTRESAEGTDAAAPA